MKRFSTIVLGIIFTLSISAQNYDPYLCSAQEKFLSGDYENAQKSLNVYEKLSGNNMADLSEKISNAIILLNRAQILTDIQDYSNAIKTYHQVLELNPNDPNIPGKVKTLQFKMDSNQQKQYKIGDVLRDGYIICYLDETKFHGWIMKISKMNPTIQHSTIDKPNNEWRMPSIDECKVIAKNRFLLGLNEAYWTSTLSKKIANCHFYFIFDFGTGKEKSVCYDKKYRHIYIKNF